MAFILKDAEVAPARGLRVERQDIRFFPTADGRIRIEITVHNDFPFRSAPTPLRIQTAGFGAFLPPRDLATLTMPPIEPESSRTVALDADRNAWPGRGMMTSTGDGGDSGGEDADEEGRQRLPVLQRLPATLRGMLGLSDKELRDLMGDVETCFAGNLHVLIGREDVGRHMTRPLRIRPGLVNMAMMHVGDREDDYAYRLSGHDERWRISLREIRGSSMALSTAGDLVWHRHGLAHFWLLVRPPADATTGSFEVHVTQRSSVREAVVEFSFDTGTVDAETYRV